MNFQPLLFYQAGKGEIQLSGLSFLSSSIEEVPLSRATSRGLDVRTMRKEVVA